MKNYGRREFVNKMGLGVGAIAISPALDSFSSPFKSGETYKGKKLNIALIGLGRYAELLGSSFADCEYCHLAGVVTGNPNKAEKWKNQYKISDKNIYTYNNFDEIAGNPDIDLVYIVLPNGLHKEYTIRAAIAGKHVIVEKPMALNADECREMIKVCKENNVQLALGYRLHYEPTHLELQRLGQQEVFGKVRAIEVSLGYKTTDPKQWRLNKKLAGGGPLMNVGIYCVQAARYILGEEPVSVTAQFGPVTDKNLFSEVEESITWQLQFPGGAMSNSISTYNTNIDRLYAGAENGFFELSPAVSYGPFTGKSTRGKIEFPVINQQAAQMDGIAKVLLEGKELPDHISGIEGLKDMVILDAIYKSAQTGNKIML